MSEVKIVKGNIFDTQMSAIVCPVNCQGVMGKGLALKFKQQFNNKSYQDACLRGEMAPGSVLVRQPAHAYTDTKKTLIYMATKNQWSEDSQLDWISVGLHNLVKALHFYSISSVALPAIGCGCGHLPYPTVEAMIKSHFTGDGQSKTIEVYQPL